MNKKRFLAMVISLILVFSIVGCKKSTTETRLQQELQEMKDTRDNLEKKLQP